MKPQALSAADKRELIERAERRYGLAPGSGSARTGTRTYPESLIPPTTSSGATGPGGSPPVGQSPEEVVALCWSLQRCLVVLADAHASLNGRLSKGPGKEVVTSGAAYDLLEAVNPHWDPAMLWGMTSMAMDTNPRGCFWILDALDGQGRPTEIWWAAPGTVTPVRGDRKKDAPEDWYISHYLVKTEGERGKGKRYDRERVVWIHSPNPFNEFATLPPVTSALASAGLSLAAMHANRMLFETGMTGAGYVVPDEGVTWNEDEQAEVGRMFASTVKGRAGWHRVLVANRRDFEVRDLKALSPREVQFIQMLGLTQSQVCVAMGVPEPLLSPTDTTFANAREARRTLWENTVIPRDRRIAAAVKSQLLAPYFLSEADDFWFDHGEVPELQGDHAAKWALDKDQMGAMTQLARDVRAGTLTREGALQAAAYFIGAPEEIADAMIPVLEIAADLAGPASLELPILEFARSLVKDVMTGALPRASALALMAEALGAQVKATAVLADASPQDPPAAAPAGDAAPTLTQGSPTSQTASLGPPRGRSGADWPPDPSQGGGIVVYRGGRVLVPGRLSAEPQVLMPAAPLRWVDPEDDVRVYGSRAHRNAWSDELARIEKRKAKLRAIAAKLLAAQAADAAEGFDGLTDEEIAAITEREIGDPAEATPSRWQALAAALAVAALGRGAIPRWVDKGTKAMEAGLRDLAGDVAAETMSDLGSDAELDLGDGSAMGAALRRRAQRFAESTANTSWASVGDVLARGVRDGSSLGDMAAGISALDDQWQGSRAEMIAWTETHSASQEVATEAARESGVVGGRVWLSALDERVRDAHAEAHGQTVGLDEPFVVDGEECDYPGECPSPENSINCRCVQLLELLD